MVWLIAVVLWLIALDLIPIWVVATTDSPPGLRGWMWVVGISTSMLLAVWFVALLLGYYWVSALCIPVWGAVALLIYRKESG
jgi:hypothetical protein